MEQFDLLVIGGGPGGYLCAERAAETGMKVALFEQRAVGGTCLNEGCIPTKTFLNSVKLYRHATESSLFGVDAGQVTYDHAAVVKRKDKVVKKLVSGVKAALNARKVTVVSAAASISGCEDGLYIVAADAGEKYAGTKLCIATGSKTVIPPITGLQEALESGFVMTNREMLDLALLPKHLVVIGGGIIGLEMAYYYVSVGVRVTVVEMMNKIAGNTDADICDVLMSTYGTRGMEFCLSSKVLEVTASSVIIDENETKKEITCDRVLLSAGRRANTERIGLENIGVATERGAVVTDKYMRTNVENVYAVGDCNGKSMLAHTAYREAEVAVNNMIGKTDEMSYSAIPGVIYTDPEAASAGDTKASAEAKGITVREIKVPMAYSGRSMAETERSTGFCKLVLDASENKLIGIHLVGSYAAEIILSAGMMLELGLSIEQMKKFVFPHPTVGEVIREALFQI